MLCKSFYLDLDYNYINTAKFESCILSFRPGSDSGFGVLKNYGMVIALIYGKFNHVLYNLYLYFVSINYYQRMDEEIFLKLGSKIKYLRNKNNISQLDVSLKTGLTTRSIICLETGKIDPKYSTIAEALNVEICELITFIL